MNRFGQSAQRPRRLAWPWVWAGAIALIMPGRSMAGGSGLNVVVVVNQLSSNSLALGNYYCEKRAVPPQNLLRLTWTGGNTSWTLTQFNSLLREPLLATIGDRGLSNQITGVVLSMDIPYRITDATGINSTTAALFHGFVPDDPNPGGDPCTLASGSWNAYAGSEALFRTRPPTASGGAFLTAMITSGSLEKARRVIDQGLASDGTRPAQTALLAKTSDWARNVRYLSADNAVFNARVRGDSSLLEVEQDSPAGLMNLLGYQTGLATFSISSNVFVPGAMADSLTSYAGMLFEPSGQTSLLAFLEAGAAGSYGTVLEPCNYLEKFPDPQVYFYQARGFSLAECYYQGVTNPYQGLVVGEPLAAPFRQLAAAAWQGITSNAVVFGTTNLTAQFTSGDVRRPVQQVDWFIDGTWRGTCTNIAPSEGNLLQVTLNGHATQYSVPAGADLQSVSSNLTAQLNGVPYRIQTRVEALQRGDRIELRSLDPAKTGDQLSVTVASQLGTASRLTTFAWVPRTNFLDSTALGRRSYTITGSSVAGDFLRLTVTKTNATAVTVSVTNDTGSVTVYQLVQNLVQLVNATPALQSPEGVSAGDLVPLVNGAAINLRARAVGWPASAIQARLGSSPGSLLSVDPSQDQPLNENLGDLQPRNHLYLTAGLTNLAANCGLDTSGLPNGPHELRLVAYEGSHVDTQTHLPLPLVVTNGPLAAEISLVGADATNAVEGSFQILVVVNTNSVSQITLVTTGGTYATVSNLATASFGVSGPDLGVGLHPFHAEVTAGGGATCRTPTLRVRLVGLEDPFPIQLAVNPRGLRWPAVAGRRYDVLGAARVTNSFVLEDTVAPTVTGLYSWPFAPPDPQQRFYRVRVSP